MTLLDEVERAISESPVSMPEPCVDRPRPDDMVEAGCHRTIECGRKPHFDRGVIENCFDDWRVTVTRNRLPRMIEIGIVIGEAHRQSSQNARRQLLRFEPPLFLGVPREECVVELTTDEFQGLILEGHWVTDRLVALVLDQLLGILWRQRRAEELVDGQQIDGQ